MNHLLGDWQSTTRYCVNRQYLTKDNGAARGEESMPGPGRYPGGGNGNPLQYFLPVESHGERSLGGYSLQGLRESDTTEHTGT